MITYREATPEEAGTIAQLHARSWQQHYQGILRDAYLSVEVHEDRLAVWHERFRHPKETQHIIVATSQGDLCGFACTYVRHDPQWGALLDNLHVVPSWQGQGVGRTLMQASARWVKQQNATEGIYLWVFEENTAARAFYERLGGVNQEKATVDNPGGGQASVFRYVWADPSSLIRQR